MSTNQKQFSVQVEGRPSFLTFLQTECSEFCEVVDDGLVKIYRKSCPKTKHLDHFTRAGERKYGRVLLKIPRAQPEHCFHSFQQHRQPNFSQPPPPYQQSFSDPTLSEKYVQEVYALRAVLGAIIHNQNCYSANMNLLNDPNLTIPALTLALQGLQVSAANILNMTMSYSNLVSQAVIRNQMLQGLMDQSLTQNKPKRLIKGVLELACAETMKEDSKQEKQDNNQNEAIDQVNKEEQAAEVAQANTNPPEHFAADNSGKNPGIQTPLLRRNYVVDIHILAIESAFTFSFTYDDYGLAKLMKELQTLYSSVDSDTKLTYATIQPGQFVAARIFDVWHRAKVVSGLDDDGFLDLEFIDFGTCQKLPMKDVRYLYSKFKQDPIRFSHGQCVLSTKVSSMSEAAQKFFAEKALNTKLYAKVVGFSGNLCQMKVYDSNGVDFFSDLVK